MKEYGLSDEELKALGEKTVASGKNLLLVGKSEPKQEPQEMWEILTFSWISGFRKGGQNNDTECKYCSKNRVRTGKKDKPRCDLPA